MTDTSSSTRGAGILAIATGIAGAVLLAIHPGGAARDFLGMLKEEAANRLIDGVVHGGFVVVLTLQAAAFAAMTARLGGRIAAMAGLALFVAGATALSGSMVLDGLATPAIAVRYLAHPEKIENAKILFVMVSTMIGILMPLGLALQSAAVAAWGWAFAASGRRVLGALAMVLGIALVVAAGSSFAVMNPLALMAGIAGLALWAVVAGAATLRGA